MMKNNKLFASVAIICSAFCLATLTGCGDDKEPKPSDSNDYKVQYTLRVITDNNNPLGRDEIVKIVKDRLAKEEITLTQKSESVWGYEATYPNDWDGVMVQYILIESSDPVPDDLEDTPGLLFYGMIEEDLRIVAGNELLKRDLDQEHLDVPEPDEYRYVINRDAWDVKFFEVDDDMPKIYADDYTSCTAQVKINGGNEKRLAIFNAQGVSVFKADNNNEVEGVIRYHVEGDKKIRATLSTLNGNVVNMPITLEDID